MSQKEILEKLTKIEQDILYAVLSLEQSKLNIVNMKENTSEEKKMVSNIIVTIRGKIKDEA